MSAVRRIRRALLIGLPTLALLAAAVLYRLPAYPGYRWLVGAQGGVEARDFEGTLWQGSAGQVRVEGYDLGTVRWRLSAGHLLTGAVRVDWVLSGREIEASGQLGRGLFGGDATLSNVRGTGPATWLQVILQEPFFRLQGDIDLDLEQARFDADGFLVGLIGRCTWSDAAVDGTVSTPLGDLMVEFAPAGDGIVGQLSDGGGPLALEGTVTLGAREYAVDARLAPRHESVALQQALQVMGPVDGQGRTRLGITGPLLPLTGWL